MNQAISIRDEILSSNGCTFKMCLTADYQDVYYTFDMQCKADKEGNIDFEVVSPETICGITGKLSAEGGTLTFDNQALLFSTMVDGEISPVSTPWVFMKTLRSGYIDGCAQEDNGLLIQITDTYAGEVLRLNVRTEGSRPVFAEIIWNERRIMTMNVEEFCVL